MLVTDDLDERKRHRSIRRQNKGKILWETECIVRRKSVIIMKEWERKGRARETVRMR